MDDIDLNGYELRWLRDDEDFSLYRAKPPGSSVSVLMLVAARPAARSLSRLKHEYALAPVLDSRWAARPLALGRHNDLPALVLDDAGCEPLDRAMGRPLELTHFLHLAVNLAIAVGQIHQRGLVHKDIKPANVLVHSDSSVRLTGFGIASQLPQERQAPAPPEIIAGTFAYMAPEQTGRMNRSIDARSDLYSLGVTLYEMLTGTLPFAASDPMEWIHCHIARKPPPPGGRVGGIPAPIERIVLKLLTKNAEDRYQTAAGVEADLQRCLDEWEKYHRIEPFSTGEHDASDRLLIPERLYGREAQIKALIEAFDRVIASGATEMVLISGYAGIGKSSVVNELHKVLVPPRGLFATGKVDQYKRDIPYSTLAAAFQSLVHELLGKSEEEIDRWRRRLMEAVGSNGELIVNLIPELSLIIGEQPPVPTLLPREAQSRFQFVFRRFLGVFARPEHPLALFVDDLQWLDVATLDLIAHVATHPEVRYLLLVGAYRDNEVGPAHPLMRTLEMIRRAGVHPATTVLAPLTPHNIGRLVADSLRCDLATAQPLAHLVHQKTDGNPFFAIQFLKALTEEQLLAFDRGAAKWIWDLPRICNKGITENVVDLVAEKLSHQSAATQNALKQLACLGNIAEVSTLTQIQGESEDKIHAQLWEAVKAGLVFRTESAYKFTHDRVHEAAYALLPEGDRAAEHLRIGRLIASQTPHELLDEGIFDIVNHLNRGVALITTQDERDQVVELNVTAGKRAKHTTAYSAARGHFAQATALLSTDAWTQRYRETLDLYLELSECEYLVGSFAEADALFEIILSQARSKLDRAKVYSLRMKLYQVASKYSEGFAVALGALRELGLPLPETEAEIQIAVEAELRAVPNNLAGRSTVQLLDAPMAADPAMQAIINLLSEAIPCVYMGQPAFYPLVTLKAVNLSLLHGNTDQSSFAYGVYSVMLVSVHGDIASAFQFSEMSLQLNEKIGNARLRGTLLHLHGDHINFWRHHFATGLPILERAFEACLEVGDFVYGGFLAFETIWHLIEKGDSLGDVLARSVKYAAFARQSHNDAVFETIRLEQQFIAGLQGQSTNPLGMGDSAFDEAASFATIVKATFGCGVAFYHIMKQILAYLRGDYAEALDCAARVEPMLPAATMSLPIEATYHFYHALTLTAVYPTASPAQQRAYRQILEVKLKKFELWSGSCPENFRNREALVLAEVARIEGRNADAVSLYEEAIRSSRENGFIQNQALANELAARSYAQRGFATIANNYLREARSCYARWGAHGKVRQLDETHTQLSQETSPRSESTITTSIEHLELGTVTRMSQAVFSETGLDKLIHTLMVLALEHAGADRGALILPRADELWIEAEATTKRESVEIRMPHTQIVPAELPESILRYVIRTEDNLLLDDARHSSPFSGDEYLRREACRSVLCLPLIKQAKLIGVLYLENTLTPHVFTPARIAVLRLLASQAAISLENARLYAELQRSEHRYRHLFSEVPVGLWQTGAQALIALLSELRLHGVENLAAYIDDHPEWLARASESLVLEDVNHHAVQMFGARDRHELLGPLTWIWRESPATFRRALISRYNGEIFFQEVTKLPTLDGRTIDVLLTIARPRRNEDLGIAVISLVDMTERIRAHEMLQRVQADFAHAARISMLGELTASIAHELKQPLASISLNGEAALRWLDRPVPDMLEARAATTRSIAATRRAADIIGRIRAMAVRRGPERTLVSLDEIIDGALIFLRHEIQSQHVTVTREVAAGTPQLLADRVQLQQVIVNLAVNAIQAMEHSQSERREITIRVFTQDVGTVSCAVEDSGPGIAPGYLGSLFESFFTTKNTGMGMGLPICRSIIEAHGGHISASNASAHGGASFSFILPVASAIA
ncbi:Adaptive-response sensory-kinase SasA [Paraburkholderia hiiakae]|uniref:histidine kinase n=1 Tax=Paraburkholderia hiiakae TaxID=1081782 RepID=A0ABN7HS74_9BURK|nr:trifunctional serine/threonine-protein kinase/ATP-binding protein/sensor histidine kinase [Paraburkholderia hiiakae]CAD6533894.1 Adaptive-response sensory-kinase SasA [Paraburkholderia hiiakae]